MLVVHAIWSRSRLHLWGESGHARRADAARADPPGTRDQPEWNEHAIEAAGLLSAMTAHGPTESLSIAAEALTLMLPRGPAGEGRVLPSRRLAHHLGRGEPGPGVELSPARVEALVVAPGFEGAWLASLERGAGRSASTGGGIAEGAGSPASAGGAGSFDIEDSVSYFCTCERFVRRLMAQHRFVPMLCQGEDGRLVAAWNPWLSDEGTSGEASRLLAAMPHSARCCVDAFGHAAWPILEDFLCRVLDARCRGVLSRERMEEAIEARDRSQPEVAWTAGLLARADDGADERRVVAVGSTAKSDLARQVRRWIAGLDDRGLSARWRLMLRLREPREDASGKELEPERARWPLTFHVQSVEEPGLVLDAADVWALPSDAATIEGRRIDAPHELLMAELARASRIQPSLGRGLEEHEPGEIEFSTTEAYQFLREVRPLLAEQGFGVEVPEWWDSPSVRLGARLKIWGEEGAEGGAPDDRAGASGGGHSPTVAGASRLGLDSLVGYTWEIAIGGVTITLAEFEQLAKRRAPLLRLNGRWVEVRQEDVRAAMRFVRERPGGTMAFGEAMRLAYSGEGASPGGEDGSIPVVGLEATGWVRALVRSDENASLESIDTPPGFVGELRPYQSRGLSWLVLLERLGFGACLADDMGLGKTVQVLALLEREREAAERSARAREGEEAAGGSAVGVSGGNPASGEAFFPTLLVAPMSVVGNWVHEARRFAPSLRVQVHHGLERATGDAFVARAMGSHLVITTYALAHRDLSTLERVAWGRVVLDEAQCIKNPLAKQSQAVRSLSAPRRVALTGTPVENRLMELWSIIDFLNPRYLGSSGHFRSRFCVPIERHRDQTRASHLRSFVQPFVLRRLKTDRDVVADLPEKVETREYCHMTSEQASLYESCVQRMLGEVDRASGMERRGLVLATLIRLKQICNHPSQFLKDHPSEAASPAEASRSGKCLRVVEILREITGGGDQALVFTQFRQMGLLLAPMLRHHLDRDVLFFHGGTTQKQREDLVARFQKGDAPILIVSLKAGGVGLNLTAAAHVIHFDRWWNPAVENQATDRTHRIGQTRNVQVHKFVVSGTLEERIDEMIDQKTELAEQIIGSGERWLTELSTDQLRDLLRLRRDAISDED